MTHRDAQRITPDIQDELDYEAEYAKSFPYNYPCVECGGAPGFLFCPDCQGSGIVEP